ncbi:MAG: sulfatase [Bacteroidales bacterium]|jgi:uncharacterized sulfatase|nr:sulfatase [Bacteroidales bacterium]
MNNLKIRIPLMAAGVSAIFGISCKKEVPQPNVIFILADDLGYSQIGCYGSSYYKTTNIDRLASEGIRFTDAYAACAVSSPTRASIMTGKYPATLHLTDVIPGTDRSVYSDRPDWRDDYPLSRPDWQKFLPLEEFTLAEMFKEKGYQTAYFGKWLLSITKFGPESLPYNPDKQGFDQSFIIDKPNRETTDPEHDPHKSDSLGTRSVEFLRENVDKPFFLFVSFSAIHDPLMEKADSINWWRLISGSEKPENNPIIAAMLSRMDRNIGHILDAVEDLGLTKNTMIVFFSDNGGSGSDAKQTPLREGKGWLYEGGIRVPLIIKWPGSGVKGGFVSSEPVSSIDFMPTFCDLSGTERLPGIDGMSLLAHLRTGDPLPKRSLYWHYPHYHNGPPCGVVRSGKWKLIEWYENSILKTGKPILELYDLENDVSESVNLADSLKSLTMDLSGELRNWRTDVNAQMPFPNPNYK